MKLVEPFKSAQVFLFWAAQGSPHNDAGITTGNRIYYKKVKKGFFKKRVVLMVFADRARRAILDSSNVPRLIDGFINSQGGE